jgi:hypothetical protein
MFALILIVLVVGCVQNLNDDKNTISESKDLINSEPSDEISTLPETEKESCELCTNDEFCYDDRCYKKQKELIAVYVDKETYQELNSQIDRYKEDIMTDLSSEYKHVDVKIISENFDDPNTLKSNIKSLYKDNNLVGVVLVGNMPLAIFEYENCETEPCHHPVDYYYMDFDSKFMDTNNNGRLNVEKYDFNSDHLAEIWVGRIKPPVNDKDEYISLLSDYFNRNHNYRTGKLKSNGKLLSVNFIEGKEKAKRFVEQSGIWNPKNTNEYKLIDSGISKQDYMTELKKDYLLVYGMMHGNVHGQEIKENTGIYYSDIKTEKPNGFFYIFDSCKIGNIEEENNIASWYIFSGNGLAIRAFNTPVLSGGDRFPIILPLSQGVTFGDSYRISSWTADILLGDPTLRLVEPPEFKSYNVDGFNDFLNINIGDVPLADHHYPVVLEDIQIYNKDDGNFKFINIWGASSDNLVTHGISTDAGSFSGWNTQEINLPVFTIGASETKGFQISLPTTNTGSFESTRFILTKDSYKPIVKQTIKGQIKEHSNIDECDDYKSASFKDACIFSVALKKQVTNLCKNMKDNDRKDICIINIALNSKIGNQCSDISKDTTRDECYYKIAKSNKDSTLCDNIVKERTKSDCLKETGGNTNFDKNELSTCLSDFNINTNKIIFYKGTDPYSNIMQNSVNEIGETKFAILDSSEDSEIVNNCLKDLIKIGTTPQVLCHNNGHLNSGVFSFNSEENTNQLRDFVNECN